MYPWVICAPSPKHGIVPIILNGVKQMLIIYGCNIFLELAPMSGKRVRMVQRKLIHIIYPMLFGLASVLSCARAVISCRSELWSCCCNHSLAFSTLVLHREAAPPPFLTLPLAQHPLTMLHIIIIITITIYIQTQLIPVYCQYTHPISFTLQSDIRINHQVICY